MRKLIALAAAAGLLAGCQMPASETTTEDTATTPAMTEETAAPAMEVEVEGGMTMEAEAPAADATAMPAAPVVNN